MPLKLRKKFCIKYSKRNKKPFAWRKRDLLISKNLDSHAIRIARTATFYKPLLFKPSPSKSWLTSLKTNFSSDLANKSSSNHSKKPASMTIRPWQNKESQISSRKSWRKKLSARSIIKRGIRGGRMKKLKRNSSNLRTTMEILINGQKTRICERWGNLTENTRHIENLYK